LKQSNIPGLSKRFAFRTVQALAHR
jgi:hypothetical protein